MNDFDDTAIAAFAQGVDDTLVRIRGGGQNDNRPAHHPHSLMLEAQTKYVRAKTLASGVRHFRKCAVALNRPGSFEQRGAVEIIELCDDLLAALKANGSAEVIGRLSLALGSSWGQLRTRASI